jgi:hypothetical protein
MLTSRVQSSCSLADVRDELARATYAVGQQNDRWRRLRMAVADVGDPPPGYNSKYQEQLLKRPNSVVMVQPPASELASECTDAIRKVPDLIERVETLLSRHEEAATETRKEDMREKALVDNYSDICE